MNKKEKTISELTIKSVEEARELFVQSFGNKHAIVECWSLETLYSYKKFATGELEKQWAREEFDLYFSKLKRFCKDNEFYFKKMMNWFDYVNDYEKLYKAGKILLSSSLSQNGACSTAGFIMGVASGFQRLKPDLNDDRIIELFEVGEKFIKRFHLNKYAKNDKGIKHFVDNLYPWFRIHVKGVVSLDEALFIFKKDNYRPHFVTTHAKQSYINMVSAETEKEFCQKIFDDIIINGHDDCYDFRNLSNLFLNFQIKTLENTQNLYKFFSDYNERIRKYYYIDAAKLIVMNLIPVLYENQMNIKAVHFLDVAEQLMNNNNENEKILPLTSYEIRKRDEIILKIEEYKESL